jgi:hypothetical protein
VMGSHLKSEPSWAGGVTHVAMFYNKPASLSPLQGSEPAIANA